MFKPMHGKVLIYQLFPRLFGNLQSSCVAYGTRIQNGCGTFEDITINALKAIAGLGMTHIWYTGVISHASCESFPIPGHHADYPEIVKGRAGSPYAIRDYYDVCPDLASDPTHRMEEFQSLIERTHALGLQVIIDHVPNHVARDYRGTQTPDGHNVLGEFDDKSVDNHRNNDFYYLPGQALTLPAEAYEQARRQAPDLNPALYVENPARVTGNDIYNPYPSKHDWYETVKLNYGHHPHGMQHESIMTSLWSKMLDILLFWCEKGIDGFRCDMAGMVPEAYWQWVIAKVKDRYPHIIFIGEIYEPERYQGFIDCGFDYLYDKVGFYDTLIGVLKRELPASALSNCWRQHPGIEKHLLRFTENHDEQRIASDLVCGSSSIGIPGFIAAATMHRGPFLLYFGQELGVKGDDSEGFSQHDGRTTIYDYWGISEIQTWRGNESYDYLALTKDDQEVYLQYKLIGNLVKTIPAMGIGSFFDLQYAQEHENYDANVLFSFLRYDEQSVFLIVLNFDKTEMNPLITIPVHAFRFIPLEMGNNIRLVQQEGFFSLKEAELKMQDNAMVISLSIPAHRSVIMQLIKPL